MGPVDVPIQWMSDQYRGSQPKPLGLGAVMGLPRFGPPRGTRPHPIPAVYLILDKDGTVIYVGKTKDVYRRMDEHVRNRCHLMWSHGAVKVRYGFVYDEEERNLIEKFLIDLYSPVCNQQGRAGWTVSDLIAGRGPSLERVTPFLRANGFL